MPTQGESSGGGGGLPVHLDTTGELIGKVVGPYGELAYDVWKGVEHFAYHKAPVYTPAQQAEIRDLPQIRAGLLPNMSTGGVESSIIPQFIGSDLPKELQVTTAPVAVPKPIVLPGSESMPQLSGPISDTSGATTTENSSMSDLTNILGAGLEFLSGASPAQIVSTLAGGGGGSGGSPGAAAPPPLPSASGPAITASAGVTIPQTGSTTGLHRIPGTAYVNAQGQVVQVHLHKRRRRRRSLFTKSMAAEMELLFAVAGKGAIAKEIIATSRMR